VRSPIKLSTARLPSDKTINNELCEPQDDFFECFPYVCPEPVLVKCSFLYINGSKTPFFGRTMDDKKLDIAARWEHIEAVRAETLEVERVQQREKEHRALRKTHRRLLTILFEAWQACVQAAAYAGWGRNAPPPPVPFCCTKTALSRSTSLPL
jgi:hypothetical protein